MQARFASAASFKAVIESCKEIVDEANLECNTDGIFMQAMDASHVTLVKLFIPKADLQDYKCSQSVNMGLNLKSFHKILKCCGNDDVLTFSHDVTKPDIIEILSEHTSSDRISRFSHKLMDIMSEAFNIPDSEYSSVITMPTFEISKVCKDMAALGDTIEIKTDKNGLTFSVIGDFGSADISIQKSCSSIEYLKCGDVKQIYALNYLSMFTKVPLTQKTTMHLDNTVPLCIEIGYLKFYLAPKLTD